MLYVQTLNGITSNAEARPNAMDPPTWDYRLKRRGGSMFLIPPVGAAFTKQTRMALREWAEARGYFASITGDNEVSVAAMTGGPALDEIVDGVAEQRIGRLVERERAALRLSSRE